METLALTGVTDSPVLVFPHQWADACGKMWWPQAHGREEVFGLAQLPQRMPHSSVLSFTEACRDAGVISTTPAFNSLGTYSGVEGPGNRQPVCCRHSKDSLGMFCCAT